MTYVSHIGHVMAKFIGKKTDGGAEGFVLLDEDIDLFFVIDPQGLIKQNITGVSDGFLTGKILGVLSVNVKS